MDPIKMDALSYTALTLPPPFRLFGGHFRQVLLGLVIVIRRNGWQKNGETRSLKFHASLVGGFNPFEKY